MFFDKFKELCDARGVTPTKAALEAGINKSSVTYWRKNPDSVPTGQVAQKLCEYFGISRGELYGDQPQQAPACNNESTKDKDLMFALFGSHEEITEEMLADVKAYARLTCAVSGNIRRTYGQCRKSCRSPSCAAQS